MNAQERRRRTRDLATGLAFLAPNIAGFLLFTLIPLAVGLGASFTNWNVLRHNQFRGQWPSFVGLENFRAVLAGADFWRCLGNTLYLMCVIPFSLAGSLGLALLLSRNLRIGTGRRATGLVVGTLGLIFGCTIMALVGGGAGATAVMLAGVAGMVMIGGVAGGSTVYRTLFYLPSFVAGVPVYILWRKMYDIHTGPVNQSLRYLLAMINRVLTPLVGPINIEMPGWLGSIAWSKPAIMLMAFWIAVGSQNMLLYLAGLSNISGELYEAADLDGAGRWARFRHVTWPQLYPTTFFILTMSIIGGLQGGFDMARAMTGGGPAGSTTTLSYYIYNEGFEVAGRVAYACAVGVVLFVLVFGITVFNWRFGRGAEVE